MRGKYDYRPDEWAVMRRRERMRSPEPTLLQVLLPVVLGVVVVLVCGLALF